MAKNDQELKNQQEINRLKKEELEIDKKSAEFSKADVANSDDFSSLLRDNLKNLKLVDAAKSEILSIDRRITKQVNEAFVNEKKMLGTKKASADLAKQQLQLERDIEVLKQKSGAQLTTDKRLQQQINNTLRQRRKDAEKLLEINKENAKISKEIQSNLSVRTFAGLEGIASKIGLGDFASELGDAAQAAREAAGQNIENLGKTKGGLAGIKNELFGGNRGAAFSNLSEEELEIVKKATSVNRGEKGFGAGLTQELMEKAGLKSMGTGVGAAANIQKAGGIGGIQQMTKAVSPLLKGIKALGPALKKAFGPLAILMEIMKIDKVIGDMAKGLNMNYQEATQLKSEMTSVANESGNNFVTSQKLSQTLMEINKSLGTGVQLSDEMLVQFTEMREMAGFTNEELMGIAKISMSTGKEMNDITGEFMAQAKLSSVQNGVLLNEKELLKSIKDVSAATTLSLGQNPVELAKAVATAKSLGMELSAVENIASGMLDFEQSIAAELQAELLTGKEINLEKARQAALDNDLATLAEEVAKNVGSAAEFGKMNRIQQDAIAKSVNMSREDLAKTLFVQEQLRGATGEQAEEQAALINKRIEEVGLAQAQKEMAQDGVEGLRQQASMADRLTAAMDKLNEVFVSLIEPLMPILDIFIGIFDFVGMIVKALKPLFDFVNFAGAVTGDLFGNIGNLIMGDEIDFSSTMAAGNRLANDNYLGRGIQSLGVENVFASGNSDNSNELKRLNDNLEKGITANTYLDGNNVSNALAVQSAQIQ
jgi:hypothetical protein